MVFSIRICACLEYLIDTLFDEIGVNWDGVLFLTQAWVLLKWKSTQLDIFILW